MQSRVFANRGRMFRITKNMNKSVAKVEKESKEEKQPNISKCLFARVAYICIESLSYWPRTHLDRMHSELLCIHFYNQVVIQNGQTIKKEHQMKQAKKEK